MSLLEPTRFSVRSAKSAIGLKQEANRYILRRLKTDVLQELPDVIDTKELLELTSRQQAAYNSVVKQPLSKDANDVLQRFTSLRSICDMEPKSEASSKLDRIVEMMQAIRERGEKAVIFSYILRPLHVLSKRLGREHSPMRTISLTGDLTIAQRNLALEHFRSDAGVAALLCSSRVGGEGITLTEANHVIFVNEWWNPSSNAQARDRVVRMGQERVVHVHRFRCRGTIEEKLDDILRRKTDTFVNFVDALASGGLLNTRDSKELAGEMLEDVTLTDVPPAGMIVGRTWIRRRDTPPSAWSQDLSHSAAVEAMSHSAVRWFSAPRTLVTAGSG